MSIKKWTIDEIETHVLANLESGYNSAVIIGALFFKLYGEYPDIGLSGCQGLGIRRLVEFLPEPNAMEVKKNDDIEA